MDFPKYIERGDVDLYLKEWRLTGGDFMYSYDETKVFLRYDQKHALYVLQGYQYVVRPNPYPQLIKSGLDAEDFMGSWWMFRRAYRSRDGEWQVLSWARDLELVRYWGGDDNLYMRRDSHSYYSE